MFITNKMLSTKDGDLDLPDSTESSKCFSKPLTNN
jgi:hypothetical protein